MPDSFSPIAFLAPWAWFPWNRMWLVTFAYLAAIGLVTTGLIVRRPVADAQDAHHLPR